MVKYLNNEFVANLLLSRLVKKFENRIIVSEVMAKSLVSCFFDSRCSFVVFGVNERVSGSMFGYLRIRMN